MAGEKKATEEKAGFFKEGGEGAEKVGGDAHFAEIARNLPGPKKAAIVMVALGSEASSKILKNLDEHDVERLSTEIAKLDNISPEIRQAVIEEFHNLAMAQQFVSQGGIDYAREILESALGPRKAKEILEKCPANHSHHRI